MIALRFASLWLGPVLVLGVAAHLYAGGAAGPLLVLLVVLGPCGALIGGRTERAAEPSRVLPALTLLAALLLLWAGLALIGDIASGVGAPRWRGIVIAAGCAFALTVWPPAGRWWPRLVPAALLVAWLVLAAVAHASGLGPMAAWASVASRAAFCFETTSPWVRSGGTFPTAGVLTFSEPHRVQAASPDVFGVIVSDGGTTSLEEWRPRPGAAITLRPGDRLSYPAGARLIFETGRRVPGAPRSGAAWADPAVGASGAGEFVRFLGLALTFVVGSFPLLRPGAPPTRAGAAVGLALALAAAGWAEAWAVYAAWAAPDLFLGTVRAGALVALPSLAVGGPWGRRLTGVLVVAVLGLFVAGAAGLRERIAVFDRGGGHDLALWSGVLGLALVGSLWPHEPWALLVLAQGLLASTLGPLALMSSAIPVRTQVMASGLGLAAFAVGALGGRASGGAVAATLGAYPALLGAPAAWAALRLARPRPA